MTKAQIVASGSYLPPKVVTNHDIEKLVDTSDKWIFDRTGISERRIVDYETSTSDIAFFSAKKALKQSKLKKEEIDLIVVGTTTPDTLYPSVACILQERLGLKNAACFDVSAACSGFNYALSVVSSFIESGNAKNVLLVGADTSSKYLDWTDRSTCILFGDGAGAMVVRATDKDKGVLANYVKCKGQGWRSLIMPGGGSRDPEMRKSRFIKMNGKEVFKFAVAALGESVLEVLKKAGLTLDQMDLLIPHQANVRIVDHVKKKLNLPQDRIFVNLEKYGNTSAASVPIAFDEAKQAGKIKEGDIVVLAGFGAGLTYAANVVRI